MDWSTALTTGMTDMVSQITTAVPVIIPYALTIIGIGVIWKVIKGFIKTAK